MMSRKYPLPTFLEGKITQTVYLRWLSRKSIALVKRDKRRGNFEAVNEAYKIAIHAATADSRGLDEYTGEPLRCIPPPSTAFQHRFISQSLMRLVAL